MTKDELNSIIHTSVSSAMNKEDLLKLTAEKGFNPTDKLSSKDSFALNMLITNHVLEKALSETLSKVLDIE